MNSTSRDLQLNQGSVSKSLLQAGGHGIYTECQQNAPNGIKFGDTVVTSGGNLNCQFIVHGACCQWDGGAGESEKVLSAGFVCLLTTRDNLPVIGCVHLWTEVSLNPAKCYCNVCIFIMETD